MLRRDAVPGLRPPPAPDADPLTHLLHRQSDVLDRRQALRHLSPKAVRHRVASGRWQLAGRGVYVAHTGPLTREQLRWVAVLGVRRAVLGGLSALELLGLRGYRSEALHVLIPAGRKDLDPPYGVVVHRTRHLLPADVHRLGLPPCTMPARSLVDAARWAATDNQARAIVAAGFQQRLVNSADLDPVLARMPNVRRRRLIINAATDARDGAASVPESDFLRLCRRADLPTPSRQVRRTDARGRRRYLDVYFDEWRVHVEIDGGQHLEVGHWWADMRRQNDLWISGVRILRFPAWVVRDRPAEVIAQLRAALQAAGWRP
ncbi:hypothetical protein BDK92_4181 [Micromonospora pisi]|uniref:Very-short-patch-repair endonuclease n=1 Tax=Micromonospora pisi TaxID=589240 RepID=A0A495JN97_9ACTN|nr:hypothetical protein [Micromonospora pisi]RKR89822.1 hypothetical protein BDK92_4181 [Micromonospora pisi]